jgi:Bacterial Ig domain
MTRMSGAVRGAVGALFVALLCAAGISQAAAQSLPGSDWAPAAGAAGDNTYVGFIDQPAAGATIAAGASFQVSGWVVDTTAEGWSGIDDVQVLLGTTVLTHLAVGLSRPDVANALDNPYFAASGFSGVVASALASGSQTLTVLAHTPGKGSWSEQLPITVSGSATSNANAGTATGLVLKIISPSSNDVIVSNNNGAIFGIAYDTRTRAELGIGVDRVQVYLDGPRGEAGSQALGDATFSGDNWSLAWEPTKYNRVKHHILFVYAHSSVTGEEQLLTEEIYLST